MSPNVAYETVLSRLMTTMIGIDEHSSLREMSINIRFTGLGLKRLSMKRMYHSMMVPISNTKASEDGPRRGIRNGAQPIW